MLIPYLPGVFYRRAPLTSRNNAGTPGDARLEGGSDASAAGGRISELSEWQWLRACPPPVAESRASAVCAAIGERGRRTVANEGTEHRKRTAGNAGIPMPRRTPGTATGCKGGLLWCGSNQRSAPPRVGSLGTFSPKRESTAPGRDQHLQICRQTIC